MNHPSVRVDRVWAMSREREQMFSLVCSPGLLATLAGHWTGAGEVTPSRRLWTSYQSSDLCFFPVSAVGTSGRFSTSHARLQPLPLSKRKMTVTAGCHTPRQQTTLQERKVQVCPLLRNPQRPGPCPTKTICARAGSHPWVRCPLSEKQRPGDRMHRRG